MRTHRPSIDLIGERKREHFDWREDRAVSRKARPFTTVDRKIFGNPHLQLGQWIPDIITFGQNSASLTPQGQSASKPDMCAVTHLCAPCFGSFE
jgi:hypothetical protein